MTEIKRCVICKRPRQRAIREQVNEGQTCPNYNCPFRGDILSKIEETSRIKIIKKQTPPFRIIKK